jgi:hypothetical protein
MMKNNFEINKCDLEPCILRAVIPEANIVNGASRQIFVDLKFIKTGIHKAIIQAKLSDFAEVRL